MGRNQTEWTDYCINRYIDLLLALGERQWLEWEVILAGILCLWWIMKYNDLIFDAGGRTVTFLSFDSGRKWDIHTTFSTQIAYVILMKFLMVQAPALAVGKPLS